MSYGKVHEEYWDGKRIEPLSDRAALLGLFLITGPHRNAIGCFRLGVGAITDIARFGKWGIEGVSDTLSEMVETGFIVRDEHSGWTLITNALIKDPISGPKVAVHALSLVTRVPSDIPLYQALANIIGPQLDRYSEALEGKSGYPLDTLSHTHSIPKRSPLPEPEQEQEDSDAGASDATSTSSEPDDNPEKQSSEDSGQLDQGKSHTQDIDHLDIPAWLWRDGLDYLTGEGIKENHARSLLGKWRKKFGDEATKEVVSRAKDGHVSEPVAWIEGALRAGARGAVLSGGQNDGERSGEASGGRWRTQSERKASALAGLDRASRGG